MSHFKERAEKNCLNCGTEVKGRFCQYCGQENIEPKESFWGLVTHFFHDITHFDGKFFTTLKLLITKPGFLSKEYILGRRARHLHPIRMYVFTSALFFILFFTFFFSVTDMGFGTKPTDKNRKPIAVYSTDDEDDKKEEARVDKKETPIVPNNKDTAKKDTGSHEPSYRFVPKAYDTSQKAKDSPVKDIVVPVKKDTPAKKQPVIVRKNSSEQLKDSAADAKTDSTGKRKIKNKGRENFNILLDTDEFLSVEEYDSAQKKLAPKDRDGWLTRMIKHKEIEIDKKVQEVGMQAVMSMWADKFMHSFPQILFLSLPLLALILQLLYVRRNKQFYYVSHGIFLIHIYIYSFINLIVYFLFGKIGDALQWNWIGWLQFVLVLHAIWYVYKAMRKFYGQGRFKTIVKFLLLNFLTTFVIMFLFIVFMLLSAWNL